MPTVFALNMCPSMQKAGNDSILGIYFEINVGFPIVFCALNLISAIDSAKYLEKMYQKQICCIPNVTMEWAGTG